VVRIAERGGLEQQQKDFPHLSRMALDFLSIPGMSAEPKRLFSSTKITISDLRSRLGSNTIKALECLRSWLKIKDSEVEALVRIMGQIREDQDIPVEEKGGDNEEIRDT
jgi:hypothetical protein